MGEVILSPDELATRGRALFGERWQTALAQELGVADRTVRRWLAGETAIPPAVGNELQEILEERLRLIGGLVGYGINLHEKLIVHHPTAACYRIGEDDKLAVLFDKLVPVDQRSLVMAVSREALRKEPKRSPMIAGPLGRRPL